MFSRSAARVFGQRSRRMKTINVANLTDHLGGNDCAAAGGGRKGLSVVFHHRFQLFLNTLNFLSQIKQAAHSSFHPLFENGVCAFWRASHPITQSFLGEWVLELGAVAGVVNAMEKGYGADF